MGRDSDIESLPHAEGAGAACHLPPSTLASLDIGGVLISPAIQTSRLSARWPGGCPSRGALSQVPTDTDLARSQLPLVSTSVETGSIPRACESPIVGT
jgi:hypothetical protein